jgi:uncharacterized cupin superfamily protein
MRKHTLFILGTAACLMSSFVPAMADTDYPQPEKLSKEAIAGAVFSDPRLIVQHHDAASGRYKTEDVENFLSSDKKFDSGMYRSGPVTMSLGPYGVDEFMYFLEGGVTLTSEDGTVTEIKAGDAVTIAKEWRGTWETEGYTKIYVIYSATPMDGSAD